MISALWRIWFADVALNPVIDNVQSAALCRRKPKGFVFGALVVYNMVYIVQVRGPLQIKEQCLLLHHVAVMAVPPERFRKILRPAIRQGHSALLWPLGLGNGGMGDARMWGRLR